MPLKPNTVGKAVADYFMSNAPAAGTPITATQLETLWEGAMSIIDADLQTNMQILPGTFEVTVTGPSAGVYPVLGVGGPAE